MDTAFFSPLTEEPRGLSKTEHWRILSGIPADALWNTGPEALVMDENRGGYGCKDCLNRVYGLRIMGVRS